MAPRSRPLEQSLGWAKCSTQTYVEGPKFFLEPDYFNILFQPKGFYSQHSLVRKSDASPLDLGIVWSIHEYVRWRLTTLMSIVVCVRFSQFVDHCITFVYNKRSSWWWELKGCSLKVVCDLKWFLAYNIHIQVWNLQLWKIKENLWAPFQEFIRYSFSFKK